MKGIPRAKLEAGQVEASDIDSGARLDDVTPGTVLRAEFMDGSTSPPCGWRVSWGCRRTASPAS